MRIAPHTKKELDSCSAVYISIKPKTYMFPKAMYTSRRYVSFFSSHEMVVRMVVKKSLAML